MGVGRVEPPISLSLRMNPQSPSPGSPASGRPAWLIPSLVVGLALVLWAFLGQRRPDPRVQPAPTPPGESSDSTTTPAPALGGSALRSLAGGPKDPPSFEPPLDASAEGPPITAELRQERAGLFEKLTTDQDPTLAAVTKAFEVQGIRQPDALASGWILAQHWAIAARAEALVEAKIEDPAKRKELAEVRQRVLIGSAEAEVRGLLPSSPDSRLFSDLETIGRALKDQPPVAADLLPNRAAARAQREARRPKSDLPSEE